MLDKDAYRIKIKRILLFWQELSRMQISTQASLDFMVYVFALTEERIMRIIRENELEELECVRVDHWDLDLKSIDAYVNKVQTGARNTRKKIYKAQQQISLF